MAKPSALGEIESVEVVEVSRLGMGWNFVETADAVAGVVLSNEDAQRAAALFRRLLRALQSRCHMPPYIVRFIANGQRLCEFSMCWECNNAHGRWGGRQTFSNSKGKARPRGPCSRTSTRRSRVRRVRCARTNRRGARVKRLGARAAGGSALARQEARRSREKARCSRGRRLGARAAGSQALE